MKLKRTDSHYQKISLDDINHAALQTQIHDSKGLNKEEFKHEDEFVVSIYGIDLKFIKNETVSK
jgi:hypothetical protein